MSEREFLRAAFKCVEALERIGTGLLKIAAAIEADTAADAAGAIDWSTYMNGKNVAGQAGRWVDHMRRTMDGDAILLAEADEPIQSLATVAVRIDRPTGRAHIRNWRG